MTAAAFYCVSDARYFLGAVGLVNSLRLQGHREPIYVLDRGLEPAQRRLLEQETELVQGPPGAPPWLQKTIAPLRHPAEVSVLIDADMIATRPLGDLIAKARPGSVVAFENDTDRFFEQWSDLLGLPPVRRAPYVSSGLVALGGETGRRVLETLDRLQERVDERRIFAGAGDPAYPFFYPEQDVLNAILASEVEPGEVFRVPHALAPVPPYRGVRITDERRLRCRDAGGREPYVLHQYVRKPWLEPMFHGVYPRLLARLLLGDDVPIRLSPDQVPRRWRSGWVARALRVGVDAYDLTRWHLLERLPAWWRRRGASG